MGEWRGEEAEIAAVYREALEAGLTGPSDRMLATLIARARAERRPDVRPEVLAFALLMEAKLREHDDRPGWKDTHTDVFMDRLVEERRELRCALNKLERVKAPYFPFRQDSAVKEAAREAAWEAVDVANFAMMIADNLGALDESGEGPADA